MLMDKEGRILAANRGELWALVRGANFATGENGSVTLVDVQRYINHKDVRLGTINGGHRREAKILLREENAALYRAQETLRYTSFHLYCGLSPPQARHISNVVNMTGSATVADSNVVKLTVSARVLLVSLLSCSLADQSYARRTSARSSESGGRQRSRQNW